MQIYETKTTTYRGFNIVRECAPYGMVIWVEDADGPFDAPTMKRAREYIDAIIEENEEIAAHAASK